jgi:DNA-binding transcriptional regulator of glucitol operon
MEKGFWQWINLLFGLMIALLVLVWWQWPRGDTDQLEKSTGIG